MLSVQEPGGGRWSWARPGVRALPELRAELLRRAGEDQDARERRDWPAVALVEAASASWLRPVVDVYGWPGRAAVGADGAHAAWVLAQHAPLDLQLHCLPLLAAAVLVDDAEPVCLAYLVDRVLACKGRPQLFGTQYATGGRGLVRCTVDHPDRVRDRQRRLGLPPFPFPGPAGPQAADGLAGGAR